MADKARKRAALFKAEELNVLFEEVEANKGLLFDRFKGAQTNKQKVKKWGEIAKRMTAVAGITRSSVDVRKKWQDFASITKKKASEFQHQSNLTGVGLHRVQALNDDEKRAMAIIGYPVSQSLTAGVDIHAGIKEEADPSGEQWKEEEEPRIPHQSTSAIPASIPAMTPLLTTATPSTVSTATASVMVELEREKVALLKDVCGLLREASERDAKYQQEVIVLKRAKLDLMARRLALEGERFEVKPSIITPEQQDGDADGS
ncbi:uncharacterized protein LOC132462568 [Gadus macrocephalus]|uniref:uncharacterized protein LOC132462568 n=1 Tax=Gadus macrocephalus TaxID=80720 RepID=UPI0028CBA36E|nr:uncharacterized protein LOC132462568 [Gadus macrocephalus]